MKSNNKNVNEGVVEEKNGGATGGVENSEFEKRYRKIIDELPKGSLSESNKNGQKYYYLKYKEKHEYNFYSKTFWRQTLLLVK